MPFNDAGDLGAEDGLALVGRSTLVPLKGGFDAVAFVSGPDSTISPSEGTDEDLDLGCDMVANARGIQTRRGNNARLLDSLHSTVGGSFKNKAQLAKAPATISLLRVCEVQPAVKGLPSHQSLGKVIKIPGTLLAGETGLTKARAQDIDDNKRWKRTFEAIADAMVEIRQKSALVQLW